MTVEVVIESSRGLVEAPAGCGKTHLIVEAISKAKPSKPILVLTHTTAGVTSLRQKLKSKKVAHSSFRVATIDGWALRVANMFPVSCQIHSFKDLHSREFYPNLRNHVLSYIAGENLTEIVQATYSRIFVDEYQDCGLLQHQLISTLAQIIPTIIFGDPMQTIFDFGDENPHPDWKKDVLPIFPLIHTLHEPWRWKKHNKDLGDWILGVREQLKNKEKLDLSQAHQHVSWNCLEGSQAQIEKSQTSEFKQILSQKSKEERIFVIGDSEDKNELYSVAKRNTEIDVVEPVELGDIMKAVADFDKALKSKNGYQLGYRFVQFLESLVLDIENDLFKRVKDSLENANEASFDKSDIWGSFVAEIIKNPSIENLIVPIEYLQRDLRNNVFRKYAFSLFKESAQVAKKNGEEMLGDSANLIREQRRQYGDKRIPQTCVGSTLLLKGLEAEYVMLLNANKLAANHLYVAISRGIKQISIFSEGPMVG